MFGLRQSREQEDGDTGRSRLLVRDRFSWVAVFAGTALAGVIVALSLTPPPKPAFPGAITTAEGVLLTAIVFLLGFAQTQYKGTCEEAFNDLRDRDKVLSDAVADFPQGRWRIQAEELAREGRIRADVLEQGKGALGTRARWLNSYTALKEEMFWPAFVSFDQRPERSEKERHRAARDLARMKDRARRLEIALQVGAPMSAYLSASAVSFLGGGLERGLAAATASLRLASALVASMLGLALVACTYTHWAFTWPPEPAWWAVLVFISAAFVYVRVVERDMNRTNQELARNIKELPLTALSDIDDNPPDDIHIRFHANGGHLQDMTYSQWEALHSEWKEQLTRLRTVEQLRPKLRWSQSIRAQYHLLQAKHDIARLAGNRGLEAQQAFLEQDPQPFPEDIQEWRASWEESRELVLRHLCCAMRFFGDATGSGDEVVVLIGTASATELLQALQSRAVSQTPADLVDQALAVLDSTLTQRREIPDRLGLNGSPDDQLRKRTWLWPEEQSLRERIASAINLAPEDVPAGILLRQ